MFYKLSLRCLSKQAKSHLCAAKCCENLTPSKEEVQQCMNRCFVPIQQIQEYLGKELTGFQVSRLLVWFGGDF